MNIFIISAEGKVFSLITDHKPENIKIKNLCYLRELKGILDSEWQSHTVGGFGSRLYEELI